MPLFAMKSLAQSASLEDVSGDYKTARRVEQFRVSNEAIYFPAFPANQYLPFEALLHVKVRDTALSVTGTCGKQARAEEVLERIRIRRPELEMDIAAPSSMLER